MLPKFEEAFANFIGSQFAVAVNSGTSGLHLVIKSLGIGKGDLVITTPFSFVASANCILFEQAKPIFADIDPLTYNIDVERLEETYEKLGSQGETVKAILPVHVFGQPCEMDSIIEFSRRYGLMYIEDACEAIGAEYKGKKAGSFGDAGVFAFYPNKQIMTGEGGIITTNDKNCKTLPKST